MTKGWPGKENTNKKQEEPPQQAKNQRTTNKIGYPWKGETVRQSRLSVSV